MFAFKYQRPSKRSTQNVECVLCGAHVRGLIYHIKTIDHTFMFAPHRTVFCIHLVTAFLILFEPLLQFHSKNQYSSWLERCPSQMACHTIFARRHYKKIYRSPTNIFPCLKQPTTNYMGNFLQPFMLENEIFNPEMEFLHSFHFNCWRVYYWIGVLNFSRLLPRLGRVATLI
jgi:hypothetical protein